MRQDIIEEVELYCPCGCGHVMEERIWRHSPDREIIWSKKNPMPESVSDRCTKAHEHLFLMAKSSKYYYDAEVMTEPVTTEQRPRMPGWDYASEEVAKPMGCGKLSATRNKRSVWTLATQAYNGAHFATYPEKLIRPCVLAGCPPGGIVIDPFLGSGTTVRVCEDFGRRWFGIELNKDYEPMIAERTAQKGLFNGTPKKKL